MVSFMRELMRIRQRKWLGEAKWIFLGFDDKTGRQLVRFKCDTLDYLPCFDAVGQTRASHAGEQSDTYIRRRSERITSATNNRHIMQKRATLAVRQDGSYPWDRLGEVGLKVDVGGCHMLLKLGQRGNGVRSR